MFRKTWDEREGDAQRTNAETIVPKRASNYKKFSKRRGNRGAKSEKRNLEGSPSWGTKGGKKGGNYRKGRKEKSEKRTALVPKIRELGGGKNPGRMREVWTVNGKSKKQHEGPWSPICRTFRQWGANT